VAAAAVTASVAACSDDDDGRASGVDAGPDPGVSSVPPEAGGVDAGPTSVRGHVMYYEQLDPVAGATVKRGDTTVTTGSDGSFAFDGYSGPYDLTITFDIRGKKHFHILEGLTTASPEVEVDPVRPDRVTFGHVTGTIVRPGGFPMPSGHRIQIIAKRSSTIIEAAQGNGSFDLEMGWRGTDARSATIYAIEYTGFPDFPTAYNAYGSAAVQVSDGGPISGLTITLTPVSSAPTNVTFSAPAPLEATLSSVVLVADRATPIGFNAPLAPSPFTVNVPSIGGLPFAILAGGDFVGDGGGASFDGRFATGAAVALETGQPLVAAPPSGTTFEGGVPFSWSPRPSGVYHLRDYDPDGTYVLSVFTPKISFTWPADLVPKSGTHKWRVAHYPRATTDSFVGTLPRSVFGLTRIDERNLIVP
jgi:hypothetical protein